MLPSIRLLPVHSCLLEMFIISVTSATVTPPFSIVPQMLQRDSFHASRGLKKPLKMRRNGSKKMSTGQFLTRPKKMESAADVVATPISETWKGKRAAVWLSGSMLPAGGHHLETLNLENPRFMSGTRCLGMRLSEPVFGAGLSLELKIVVSWRPRCVWTSSSKDPIDVKSNAWKLCQGVVHNLCASRSAMNCSSGDCKDRAA